MKYFFIILCILNYSTLGIAAVFGKNYFAFVVTPRICFHEKYDRMLGLEGLNKEQKRQFTTINQGMHFVKKKNILIRRNSGDMNAQNELFGGDAEDDSSGDGEDTDMNTDKMNNSDNFDDGRDLFLEEEVSSTIDFSDLGWRVEKLRLEEANTKRFLRAGPRFLPYSECRKWVKAWNRWETKEDWLMWIDEGEKRNSYIPSRPDKYYGNLGHWRGWDHFLGKIDD